MLSTSCLSTEKFKNISKQQVSYLLSHFGLCLKKEYNFQKISHSFIDLRLHFDLFENESCSTFVTKAGFFYAQKYI